jgi:hypothetical protein
VEGVDPLRKCVLRIEVGVVGGVVCGVRDRRAAVVAAAEVEFAKLRAAVSISMSRSEHEDEYVREL